MNQWSFLAGTYNQTTQTLLLYLNGKLVSSGSFSGFNIGSSVAPLYLGALGGAYIPGDMANAQVYNATLSANEIYAMYLSGIGGAPVRPQNIVGWWPLNGNGNDYSGNNNNGQLNGVTFTSSWTNGYTPP